MNHWGSVCGAGPSDARMHVSYGGGFRFGLPSDILFRIITPSVFCGMIGFPSQPVPRPNIALAITLKLDTSSEYQKCNALTVRLWLDVLARQ